jgi:hypothetical protein
MANDRRPRREAKPLPPPLPPETRTIGQLVAESVRLYARRFWRSLAVGLGPAVLLLVVAGLDRLTWLAVMWTLGALLLTASYIGAAALVADVPLRQRRTLTALAVGLVVWVPFPVLASAFVLPGLAWLALVGLAVPAALVEGRGFKAALRRGIELARADYVHALGSLATLAITAFLTQGVLFFLLRGSGNAATSVAAFLASLVISPLLFLGAGMLYVDQAARVGRRGAHGPRLG